MDCPYPDFDFDPKGAKRLLVAVDLSNEFVSGVLGSGHAEKIVPWAAWFYSRFVGTRKLTRDIHGSDYLRTQEGINLPVLHGQDGTHGAAFVAPIAKEIRWDDEIIEKHAFGSGRLYEHIKNVHYDDIYLMGVKTDICVISNAVLAKTADPEARIHVLSKLCSGVTKQSHETALEAMRALQIDVM